MPGVDYTQIGIASRAVKHPDLTPVLKRVEVIFGHSAPSRVKRRGALILVVGPERRFSTDRVLLIDDVAGLFSSLTGGQNAFRCGRRAVQTVSDHLQDRGPEPSSVLAGEVPSYGVEGLMRCCMDIGAPDCMTEALLDTPLMAAVARHVFFNPRTVAIPQVKPAFRPAPAAGALGAMRA